MTPDFPDKPLSEDAGRRLERATDSRYRLLGGAPAGDELRRVAHGRVGSALGQLRRESSDDVAVAVHEARKDLKKLRSLLRLVRDDLGKRRYRAEQARYRDAGRRLAGLRDAEVKLATLAALREHYPHELHAVDDLRRERHPNELHAVDEPQRERHPDDVPAIDALQSELEAERDRLAGEQAAGLADRLERAADEIAAGGAEIDAWELSGDFELLRGGLERSYRRGRDAFRALGDDPSAEAVHEWRKRVKDLWYHLRLLRESWPEALKGPIATAAELADLLGDHNDLAVLIADLEARAPGDREMTPIAATGPADTESQRAAAAALIALAHRRQRELLAAALPLADRLYAEKPKRFAARLAAYWSAWRSGDGT